MKRTIIIGMAIIFAALFIGCGASSNTQGSSASNQPQKKQQTTEEQFEAQWNLAVQLIEEDYEKLTIGNDNRVTFESIEAAFQPKVINSISEITDASLSEPGRPYHFKLQALFKGHDADAERIFLEGLGQRQVKTVLGLDANTYSVGYGNTIVSSLPTEVNATATFYIIAVRFVAEENGRQENETRRIVSFIRHIERSPFNPSNFILANGMHFITVNDARETASSAPKFLALKDGVSFSSGSFDPIRYTLVDLMDLRIELDKKDSQNQYELLVGFVSEVIFRGQVNTTITVSTDDNIFTEKMYFTKRASSIRDGERIRVYYTIAENPLDPLEIQAIERL